MSKFCGSFKGKAELYSRFRPNYSQEYQDYLIKKLKIDHKSVVADIGAGTGIHTKALLGIAGKIFAIEPDSEMLHQCISTFAYFDNVTTLKGFADNTNLPDMSVDYITVAQAFHLFNHPRSLYEFKRILNPGGILILVWNSKEHDNELFYENEKVVKRYCPHYQRNIHAQSFTKGTYRNYFTPETYTHIHIYNDSTEFLDKESFVMRTLSASYAINSSDNNYDILIKELGNVFEQFSNEGTVKIPQSTVIYHGKIRIE